MLSKNCREKELKWIWFLSLLNSNFRLTLGSGSQLSFEQPGPAVPFDYFTWSHRLSKRHSLSTTTVLFRATFTWTIKLKLLLKLPLGSNLSQWFVVIFGINTMSDISKLLYVISRTVRRVKFETILKYHKWYLLQILRTNHALFILLPTKGLLFSHVGFSN